jgi:hypothetical protein
LLHRCSTVFKAGIPHLRTRGLLPRSPDGQTTSFAAGVCAAPTIRAPASVPHAGTALRRTYLSITLATRLERAVRSAERESGHGRARTTDLSRVKRGRIDHGTMRKPWKR